MIALIQRVTRASVEVDGATTGAVQAGLLAFVCAERGDRPEDAHALARRVIAYRVFPDDAARMNRSLVDMRGGLLAVPQFTLAADTSKGLRPSFSDAAEPEAGRTLFEAFVAHARRAGTVVETGLFGAHMRVSLVNDGPATFWLRARGTA